MCHGRGLNNKINNIHGIPLRKFYQGKKSSFETLLKRDKSMASHKKNLQYLAAELFKVKVCHFSGYHERNFCFLRK